MALDVPVMVVLGWVFALVMCFAMGANDESMGSAYGSRAFSLTIAIIVGAITEVAGSVLLGESVTVTVQGKLFATTEFAGDVSLLILIFLVATASASVFLIVASYFGWPVSTTHGIIGAIAGAAVGAKGFGILQYKELGFIVASWFISPLSGAVITSIFFFMFEFFIVNKKDPYHAALFMAPVFYACGVCGALAFILLKGVPLPDEVPAWVSYVILAGIFLLVLLVSKFVVLKFVATWIDNQEKMYLRDNPQKRVAYSDQSTTDFPVEGKLSALYERLAQHQNRKVEAVFVMLQLLTAPMVAFARGANDVSNGVGPLAAIIALDKHGEDAINLKSQAIEFWVLFVGGAAIAVGLFVLGRKVIKNIGDNITDLTPTRGVSVEVGTAVTVLAASAVGMPVSSTHTLIGCIVSIGVCMKVKRRYFATSHGEDKGLLELESSKKITEDPTTEKGEDKEMNWKNSLKIFISWVVTIPAAAVLAGVSVLIIRKIDA